MADITIQGNTTADPELRFTPNGGAVLNFNLAENHRKKDQQGTWQDDGTTFYRVAVWGKQAETLADHLGKGQRVLVSGRFRGGEFTSKQGEQVKTYEVTANHVGVVPKADQQQGGYQQGGQQAQGAWGGGQQSQQGPPPGQGGSWGANPNAQQDPWAQSSMTQQGGFTGSQEQAQQWGTPQSPTIPF